MSALYLFRHAQAGPRQRYDTLSRLGHRQAGELGKHLAAGRVRFRAVFSGALERHKLTAEAVMREYLATGLDFPEVVIDPLWNEFDLSAVYSALAPSLAREDARFEREYSKMVRLMEDTEDDVHRNHNYCDIAVVRAWVQNRLAYDGESWEGFRNRVLSRLEGLAGYDSGEKIAVFTSATPIGVWLGHVLGLREEDVWRLAGATYNTGMTTFRISREDLRLFTFNSLPHLPDQDLWSFR